MADNAHLSDYDMLNKSSPLNSILRSLRSSEISIRSCLRQSKGFIVWLRSYSSFSSLVLAAGSSLNLLFSSQIRTALTFAFSFTGVFGCIRMEADLPVAIGGCVKLSMHWMNLRVSFRLKGISYSVICDRDEEKLIPSLLSKVRVLAK